MLAPVYATALALGAPPKVQGPPTELPADLAAIELVDRRSAELPLDLALTDHDGTPVRLGDYFDGQHPVIVVLAYYQCPTLCSVVLNGLQAGMTTVPLVLGRDYRVVVVSFDPKDDAAKAQAKRATYLEEWQKAGKSAPGPRGWDFLVGDEATVRRLAETVGFPYRWEAKTNQFAHAAGIFLITPTGKLSNTMPGVEFKARDLELGLIEASGGKIGSVWKKLVLLCYHWDPNSRGYVWGAFRLFRYFGAFVVVALGLFFLYVWRLEKSRRPIKTEPVNVRT
jgi:protein SCO1/2